MKATNILSRRYEKFPVTEQLTAVAHIKKAQRLMIADRFWAMI